MSIKDIKGAAVFNLDTLQYSQERSGPFVLYVYGEDGMHSGRQYFQAKPEFADEQINIAEAYAKTAMGMKILYGDNFWKEIGVGNTISG